jgi:hypothetical protein
MKEIQRVDHDRLKCWRFSPHEAIAPAGPVCSEIQLSPAVLPVGSVTDSTDNFLNEILLS